MVNFIPYRDTKGRLQHDSGVQTVNYDTPRGWGKTRVKGDNELRVSESAPPRQCWTFWLETQDLNGSHCRNPVKYLPSAVAPVSKTANTRPTILPCESAMLKNEEIKHRKRQVVGGRGQIITRTTSSPEPVQTAQLFHLMTISSTYDHNGGQPLTTISVAKGSLQLFDSTSRAQSQVDRLILNPCLTCSLPQEGHLSEIHAVTFSPNSGLLATGGTDRLIKLWSVAGAGTSSDTGREQANVGRADGREYFLMVFLQTFHDPARQHYQCQKGGGLVARRKKMKRAGGGGEELWTPLDFELPFRPLWLFSGCLQKTETFDGSSGSITSLAFDPSVSAQTGDVRRRELSAGRTRTPRLLVIGPKSPSCLSCSPGDWPKVSQPFFTPKAELELTISCLQAVRFEGPWFNGTEKERWGKAFKENYSCFLPHSWRCLPLMPLRRLRHVRQRGPVVEGGGQQD
ncbi:Autophagy-related protein 16-2, partial [Ophiophagus hannah]